MSSSVLGAADEVQRVLLRVARGHAAVLGLSKNCTDEKAIGAAARQLWLKVHPDKTNNCPGSHEAFLAVKAAEKALREKVAQLSKQPAAAAAAASSPPPRTPEPQARRTAAPEPRAKAWRTPEPQQWQYWQESSGDEAAGSGGDDEYEEYDSYESWYNSSSRWGSTWSFYEARHAFQKELIAAARAAAAAKEAEYRAALLRPGTSPWAARALLAPTESVPSDGTRINQTYAMREYGLSVKDLQVLKPELLQNRHNPGYSPEKMFKHQERLAQTKFKTPHWREVLQARRARREANKARRQAEKEGSEHIVVPHTPVKRPRKPAGPKQSRKQACR